MDGRSEVTVMEKGNEKSSQETSSQLQLLLGPVRVASYWRSTCGEQNPWAFRSRGVCVCVVGEVTRQKGKESRGMWSMSAS